MKMKPEKTGVDSLSQHRNRNQTEPKQGAVKRTPEIRGGTKFIPDHLNIPLTHDIYWDNLLLGAVLRYPSNVQPSL